MFGFVVRGEEREDSDIDLLVDFLLGTTLLDQVGLIDALSNALGRRVDIVSERALKPAGFARGCSAMKDRFIFTSTALESIDLIIYCSYAPA